MSELSRKMMDHVSSVNVNIILPWLTKLMMLFNVFNYQDFINLLQKVEDIFKKEVEKRINAKEELTKDDLIGCYLQEIEKRTNDSQPHNFNVINLRGNLLMLFLAGQDATIASVSWLLLLMAKYPDVQTKVCEEIDRVIGRDGTVYFNDKTKLPYTMATMLEMLRYISIILFFLQDKRFLKEEGIKAEKVKGYGPFSFGKRNCPGEGIAMMTMYLYFVSIMQKFKIRAPDGGFPDMEYKFSAGVLPKPQKLCFIER
ncbi:cytochrome P450 2C23 [Trichonephila clavata]|uniref:Cytochrome P450 2C23 n=1 Tax=Trichonephila clavata TaxID=2740835 RepID=A0A8X6KV04_TRICU|nr:cytochrome P450 2C23 [Trichonephila clavata]